MNDREELAALRRMAELEAKAGAAAEPGMLDSALDFAKKDIAAIPGRISNLAAGAVRGAGSIGATIMAPKDIISDALDGKGLSLESNRQRRADMTGALQSMGADPNSPQFGVGKIGAEIAGTAGMGNALARGLAMIPGLAKAAPALVDAVRTGGMSAAGKTGLASLPERIAGGAVTGAATAGAINPDEAAAGAAIGVALPPLAMGTRKAGGVVANSVRRAMTPKDARLAGRIAEAVDVPAQELRAALNQQGPQLIQDYQQTVPQIIKSPVLSQMQRSLKTAGNDALGQAERAQQRQFMDTLNRVAPVDVTLQDAAARAGGAIEGFAIPAERAASRRVNELFDAIPADQAVMQLPLRQMEQAQTRFLGPGAFGKGNALVDTALNEARAIGSRAAPAPALEYSSSDLSRAGASAHRHGGGATVPQAVPFDQLQKLRSSIGEAIADAQKNGRNQAAAALTQMKNAIDNKVADVAAGNALPGEIFTPEAIDAWGQALAAHAAKKQQFATGPQVGLFRQGGDGMPAVQGAEIPGKFYSGRRSQIDDAQAFRRLVGNSPQASQLVGELQRYATTEGANTANAAGNLTSKYSDWLASRSGANRVLFDESQNAALQAIDRALRSASDAERLGLVTGSDTAQKLAGMQSLGALDNRFVAALANRIPFVGRYTGAMLDGLRGTAAKSQNEVLGRLLADPQALDAALGSIPRANGDLAKALLQFSQPAYRVAPIVPALSDSTR